MLFIICYKYVKQKLYKLKNKNMEEIKKLIGELAPELATGDVNYHHSVLIKMVKIINLQQELLTKLIKEDEN